MQDRFKFKFWDKTIKKMRYGDIQLAFNGQPFVLEDSSKGLTVVDIDDIEILQCTGLKDKDGKLIYEGDIIYKKGTKNYKGEKMYSKVVWSQMYAEFNISDDNGIHQMPNNSNNIEIIGNIYENPELLEAKNEKI